MAPKISNFTSKFSYRDLLTPYKSRDSLCILSCEVHQLLFQILSDVSSSKGSTKSTGEISKRGNRSHQWSKTFSGLSLVAPLPFLSSTHVQTDNIPPNATTRRSPSVNSTRAQTNTSPPNNATLRSGYTCEGCGETLRFARDIAPHRRLANGAQTNPCQSPGCNRELTTASAYARHVWTYHKYNQFLVSKGIFKCPGCVNVFKQSRELVSHQNEVGH